MDNLYYDNVFNIDRLAIEICIILKKYNNKVVFICVGSDRVIGDSLGPMVGEQLKNTNVKIYGDLKNVINYSNIEDKVLKLKQDYPDHKLVVIDSVLGQMQQIGGIKLINSKCYAGGNFNKHKQIGDYSILGIVDFIGINKYIFLNSVKLNLILKMSNFISKSILKAFEFAGVDTKILYNLK